MGVAIAVAAPLLAALQAGSCIVALHETQRGARETLRAFTATLGPSKLSLLASRVPSNST